MPAPLVLGTLLLGVLLGLTALSLGWGTDDGAGFAEVVRVAGYLGTFVLVGLLARPGSGRSILGAVATGVVAVAVISLASRLLGIGAGDAGLADVLPPSQGRLSFPLGYWNALGALMALGVPALVHLAATGEGRLCARAPARGAGSRPAHRLHDLLAGCAAGGAAGRARHGRARRRAASRGCCPRGRRRARDPGDDRRVARRRGSSTRRETARRDRPSWRCSRLLLAGVAAALLAGPALADALARLSRHGSRLPRVRPAIALPVALVLVVGLVLLTGPGRLVDDFRSLSPETRTEAGTGILSASGSGRAQFWGTALDAFADEPVRGIGAGGFATYWNRNGSLGTPARNAHSEPLELLAELGLAGLVCFLGFAGVVGPRRPAHGARTRAARRRERRSACSRRAPSGS